MSASTGGKAAQGLSWILLVVGGIGVLDSLLILGFAALADEGPAENRRMAVQLLTWGVPPLICGQGLSWFGILALVRNRKSSGTGVAVPAS